MDDSRGSDSTGDPMLGCRPSPAGSGLHLVPCSSLEHRGELFVIGYQSPDPLERALGVTPEPVHRLMVDRILATEKGDQRRREKCRFTPD